MTVLVNGSTSKWLLQKLGFMSHTPEEMRVLEHVVAVGVAVLSLLLLVVVSESCHCSVT